MAQSGVSNSTPAVLQRFLVTGKTVVVTGGARGLGFEFAKGLAQAGANIAVIDRDETAPPYFGQLSRAGGRHRYYKADVTDYEGLKVTINQISQDFGSINGCIPAAGIIRDRPFLQHSVKDFEDTMDVNVNGVFYTLQLCCAKMVEHGQGGSIVCIASTAGHRSLFPQTISAYTASKYAVRGLVKQVAAEMAQHKIRVNSISPGVIKTDMLESVMQAEPTRRALFEGSNVMRRLGTADELVGMVLCLMSDASPFTTGQDFLVDGGQI
ncbi:putative secondary metabolism biosynthetic enzyme [Rhinocladiella similis]